MTADAIVIAYQSADVVEACVAGLRSDLAVDRIIVVNNSPGDATAGMLQTIERVTYTEAEGNIGFGAAVNLARPLISSPYVVIANPDAVQDPVTTTSLLAFMADHPRCAVAAPRMVAPGGVLDRNSQHDLSLTRMVFQAAGGPERLQVMRPRAEHLRPHRTECVIAAFVLCRVEALDAVGWFDESIFLFGEDQDLCRRVRSARWEVWFTGVGRVNHLDGHSWRQLSDQGQQLFREARYRELRKAAGLPQAKAYRALVKARRMASTIIGNRLWSRSHHRGCV